MQDRRKQQRSRENDDTTFHSFHLSIIPAENPETRHCRFFPETRAFT
jgi:hypothetical protein